MAYNPLIGSIYHLYTYATYHLLREPETTIDERLVFLCHHFSRVELLNFEGDGARMLANGIGKYDGKMDCKVKGRIWCIHIYLHLVDFRDKCK